MIHQPEIWEIIKRELPRGQWVTLQNIYEIIEQNWTLDKEDYEPQSPISKLPKWKRNVRNVLQYRKRTQEIIWGDNAKYKLGNLK